MKPKLQLFNSLKMNKHKLLNVAIPAVVVVAFIAYAVYILVGVCSDVLITAQDRNVFTGDSLYFCEQIARPFGFFQYVGSFLTQFFYYPAVGAGMLIAIWLASAFAGIKAFTLKGGWCSAMILPAACFLAATVDLGYWVYCLTIPGYWFSQSVAFLCLMLLLWVANSTPRRFRIVWYAVIGFVLFPIFGWISYLFTICLFLSQFRKGDNGKATPKWIDIVGIIVTLIAPIIFHALLYENQPLNDVFNAGFPLFTTSTDSSLRPTIPFFILVGTTVVLSLGRVLPTVKKVPAFVGYVLVGIVSSIAVWNVIFKDSNYLYEMQMTQAAMSDDWQGVISVAEKTKTPSRAMVMLKNVALLNTNELGARSFELSNDGKEIYNPDSLNINIMHIASPVIYYNHGKINYAMRWCIEFAIPYGFSPYYLKMLTRCAEATGEKQLANRYINRLHSTLFYSDWKPAPVSPIVKELQTVCTDSLSNDENSCERYLISNISNIHSRKSKYYAELSLLYSMLTCNPNDFWPSMYDYVYTHKSNTIPTQYEEAYCLFQDKTGVKFPFELKISPATQERYQSFWDAGNNYARCGMNEDAVREAMREDWGETYWWFNAFGRKNY